MAGMLEGDYQAVLNALGAGRPRTELSGQAGSDQVQQGTRTPSIRDVADLLEFGPSPVDRVAPLTPEPPPSSWTGTLRLMDFDMPRLPPRTVSGPENE